MPAAGFVLNRASDVDAIATDRRHGNFRSVAVAAEVAEDDPFKVSLRQLRDKLGRLGIGKVAMA